MTESPSKSYPSLQGVSYDDCLDSLRKDYMKQPNNVGLLSLIAALEKSHMEQTTEEDYQLPEHCHEDPSRSGETGTESVRFPALDEEDLTIVASLRRSERADMSAVFIGDLEKSNNDWLRLAEKHARASKGDAAPGDLYRRAYKKIEELTLCDDTPDNRAEMQGVNGMLKSLLSDFIEHYEISPVDNMSAHQSADKCAPSPSDSQCTVS